MPADRCERSEAIHGPAAARSQISRALVPEAASMKTLTTRPAMRALLASVL